MTRNEILKNQKRKLNLTYKQIGERSGIPYQTVWRMLDEEDTRLERLCSALDLEIIIKEK
jgi:predicted transcriptional regulator